MRIFEVTRCEEIFKIAGVHLKSGDHIKDKQNRIDEFEKVLVQLSQDENDLNKNKRV